MVEVECLNLHTRLDRKRNSGLQSPSRQPLTLILSRFAIGDRIPIHGAYFGGAFKRRVSARTAGAANLLMSMDGSPIGQQSLLARPLVWLTKWVLRFPRATIVLAVALAVASVALSCAKLGYHASRLDLLNPSHDYNRVWIEYLNEFGDDDDALVVVEGPGREQVVPVLQELSSKILREEKLFHGVLHRIDLSKVRNKGLHYLSTEELTNIDQFLQLAEPIVQGNWSLLQVGNLTGVFAQQIASGAQGIANNQLPSQANPDWKPAGLAELERFSSSLLGNLGPDRNYDSPWPGMPQAMAALSDPHAEYLLEKDGKFGFILLRLAPGKDEFAPGSEAVDALRDMIAQLKARHPDVKLGLTGLPVMENDEMRSSQSSMTWATIVSLGGVALLLVMCFGGARHAVLTNIALILAIAWTFGYATLVVGHLNILSIAFTVTLNGLGIDYGVYYAARYVQLRAQKLNLRDALIEATAQVGPAITIGALTTAAGFLAAIFTSFTGVVELGVIAGGGIILCVISELFVLPALILVVEQGRFGEKPAQPMPIWLWVERLMQTPRLVMFFFVAFTAIIGVGAINARYDHNLLNLQAGGLESVELEKHLLNECGQSMWFALSIADSREEILARKAAFLALPTVERTEEIVSLLPEDGAQKRPIIERIQAHLAQLPERPPLIPVNPPDELGQIIAQAQTLAGNVPGGEVCARQMDQIRDRLRRLPIVDCYAILSEFQQRTAGDLLTRLHTLRSVANPDPPKLSDLPPSLVRRFVGQHGQYLLKIYGRGNIWDMVGLKRFVDELRTVDLDVTGNPLQTYEASLEMKRSYEQATLYAFLLVVAVIFLDCRSIRWTLFALLPLGMGVLQMFGLLGLMNIPLNAANMIAVPIILGVGVDYGLHVLYDFRQQTGPYRISPSTALSVMVDALTTSVGFGALMIANHQGLQSLGRVLAIGTTSCLLCAVGFLPALLTWATRNREPVVESATVTAFVISDEVDVDDNAEGEGAIENHEPVESLISPEPRINAPLSAFRA